MVPEVANAESAFVSFIRANAVTAAIGAFCVGFLVALILF